jgi:hypothetical protein
MGGLGEVQSHRDFGRRSVPRADCYVYFAMCEHGEYCAVKIGRSRDPRARIEALQTGNPDRMWIQSVIPCRGPDEARALEGQLHRRFDDTRIGDSEWFIVTASMDQFLHPERS